jgi:hypothetical protein
MRRTEAFQREVIILSDDLFEIDLLFDQQLIKSFFVILYDSELERLWWRFG